MNTVDALMEAFTPKETPQPYDTAATVIRVEEDTLWVHIPGGVDETPVQRTINGANAAHSAAETAGGKAARADEKAEEALEQLKVHRAEIEQLLADWANIGTAIIDTLIAEGISAQWMKVTDSSGNVIFSADQDSHSVKIGGWTATKDKLSSSGGGNTIALGSGQITANVIKLENSSSTDQMPTMSFYPRNGSNSMLDISAYGSSTAGYSSQLYSPTDLILRSPTGIILIAGTGQGPSGYGGVGIEGELYINGVKLSTTLSGKAPTSHAVDANTYGLGTTARYGHVKTVNNVTTAAHASGLALSAYQGTVLKELIDDLDGKITYKSGVSLKSLQAGIYYVDNATDTPPYTAWTTWICIVSGSATGNSMKIVAKPVATDTGTWEIHKTGGTWGDWLETGRTYPLTGSFSTATSVRKPGGPSYGSVLITGTVGGIGAVVIAVTINNGAIGSIRNVMTGAAWSNTNLTITYGILNNVGYLTFKTTSTANSNICIIGG